MKLCVVQTRPVKGDIQRNIEDHKELLNLAISRGADTVIFPELSITGYEPELARQLATDQEDSRFDEFQRISDRQQITIGLGVPTENSSGICISMVLFQPHKARQIYSKQYLHADEEEFFVSGQSSNGLIGDEINMALAICYEISVPEHAQNAFRNGAEVYIASVAKSAAGVDNAARTLSRIAKKYAMTVLMSNCVGPSGGFESAGKTSVWNKSGLLLGQLDDDSEGLLIIDTDTQELIKEQFDRNGRNTGA